MILSSYERESIDENTEEEEHDDEGYTDISISPWYEPESRKSDSERHELDRKTLLMDLLAGKHDSYDDPWEIDDRPYREGESYRCDDGRVHIRYISLGHTPDEKSETRNTHESRESDSGKWCDKEKIAHPK